MPSLRGPHAFAVIVGLTDGILNALTLASGHFLSGEQPTIELSLRIACGSALCGTFVFFTAEYARLRSELLESERQLNLTDSGRLATSSLGRQVRAEAGVSAAVSSVANFVGAVLPLLLASLLPGSGILAVTPAIVALGLFGALLAHSVRGRMVVWATALMVSGIAFALLGVWLRIA